MCVSYHDNNMQLYHCYSSMLIMLICSIMFVSRRRGGQRRALPYGPERGRRYITIAVTITIAIIIIIIMTIVIMISIITWPIVGLGGLSLLSGVDELQTPQANNGPRNNNGNNNDDGNSNSNSTSNSNGKNNYKYYYSVISRIRSLSIIRIIYLVPRMLIVCCF